MDDSYSVGLEEDQDQALMATNHCTRFECQWWEGNTPMRPELVQDEDSYWVCPKCRYSYGKEAKG